VFLETESLQGKLAQLLPVDMKSRKHHLSCTQSTLGCTVTVHDAQSLRTTSETQVKLKCSACQLAAVERVFLAVSGRERLRRRNYFYQIAVHFEPFNMKMCILKKIF
jgi:hypothetical protein